MNYFLQRINCNVMKNDKKHYANFGERLRVPDLFSGTSADYY